MREIILVLLALAILLVNVSLVLSQENVGGVGMDVTIQCFHLGIPYKCGTTPPKPPASKSNGIFSPISTGFSVVVTKFSPPASSGNGNSQSSSGSGSSSASSGGGGAIIPSKTFSATSATPPAISTTSPTSTTSETSFTAATSQQSQPTGFFSFSDFSKMTALVGMIALVLVVAVILVDGRRKT